VLVPLAAALAVAGCGGRAEPRFARADVAPLIALANRIPNEGPCAQARDIRELDTRQASLVRAHRVPAAFEESLASAVAGLSGQTPACVPPVSAETQTPPQPQSQPVPGDEGDDRGHAKHEHEHQHEHQHKSHGKHHGKHGHG